jgi:hypothetical protein
LYIFNTENSPGLNRGNDLDRVMTGFRFKSEKRAKAHTIKYRTRIKTIPKNLQLVPEKYRSIFVGNKIAEKNTSIDDEIRRLPALNENTAFPYDSHSNWYLSQR